MENMWKIVEHIYFDFKLTPLTFSSPAISQNNKNKTKAMTVDLLWLPTLVISNIPLFAILDMICKQLCRDHKMDATMVG